MFQTSRWISNLAAHLQMASPRSDPWVETPQWVPPHVGPGQAELPRRPKRSSSVKQEAESSCAAAVAAAVAAVDAEAAAAAAESRKRVKLEAESSCAAAAVGSSSVKPEQWTDGMWTDPEKWTHAQEDPQQSSVKHDQLVCIQKIWYVIGDFLQNRSTIQRFTLPHLGAASLVLFD